MIIATTHDHFLVSDFATEDLKVSSTENLANTRFVFKNALNIKDYGFIKYGDQVFLEAGRFHIIGLTNNTCRSDENKVAEQEVNENEVLSNVLLIRTYSTQNAINEKSIWTITKENFSEVSSSTLVHNSDQV